MKLHGKLLICARNESVELDRLINIHLGFQRAGVGQWPEQPTRLMTQIWVRYPEEGSGNLSLLSLFLSPEMELITHKSLAQVQLDQDRDWLERGFLTPQSFTIDHWHCGVTDNSNAYTERTGSPHSPASVSQSLLGLSVGDPIEKEDSV